MKEILRRRGLHTTGTYSDLKKRVGDSNAAESAAAPTPQAEGQASTAVAPTQQVSYTHINDPKGDLRQQASRTKFSDKCKSIRDKYAPNIAAVQATVKSLTSAMDREIFAASHERRRELGKIREDVDQELQEAKKAEEVMATLDTEESAATATKRGAGSLASGTIKKQKAADAKLEYHQVPAKFSGKAITFIPHSVLKLDLSYLKELKTIFKREQVVAKIENRGYLIVFGSSADADGYNLAAKKRLQSATFLNDYPLLKEIGPLLMIVTGVSGKLLAPIPANFVPVDTKKE